MQVLQFVMAFVLLISAVAWIVAAMSRRRVVMPRAAMLMMSLASSVGFLWCFSDVIIESPTAMPWHIFIVQMFAPASCALMMLSGSMVALKAILPKNAKHDRSGHYTDDV